MKRFFIAAFLGFACFGAMAATSTSSTDTGSNTTSSAKTSTSSNNNYTYTDAATLTVVNKLLETEKPWQRLDVEKYPGIAGSEQEQAKNSTGLAVCFETNSSYIGIRVTFDRASESINCSNAFNMRGFDLYIQEDGVWKWAGNAAPKPIVGQAADYALIKETNKQIKKCLVYFPNFSQVAEAEIITDNNSEITPADAGFKGRIAVFGSSYTHSAGCSRPGLAYVAQLSRMTGYNFINMGFSGRSHLQQYFATALIEADVDAYLFDGFSNPNAKRIEERLFPFIERFQNEKPGVPLIFMKTVYRQTRNFNESVERFEAEKMEMADKLMKEAVAKYKDVYWIDCTDACGDTWEWTSDGVHPNDYGYYLWVMSVKDRIVEILENYIK